MSTLKVNKIENTATSNGGVEIDNTGHVQIDGVQMPTAGPLSNRNLVINGAMQVAQRGTSSTTNGYETVDRFRTSWSGGTITQSQEVLSSGSPYDEGFRYFARLTNTDVTTDVNHWRRWIHYIEAQNIAQSGWDYTNTNSHITLSYWVRSSVSQEFFHYVDTRDGSQRKLFYWSTGTLAANTWTKITKTIPGHADLAFDNNNDIGLQIDLGAYLGQDTTSSSAGSADTWNDRVSSNRTPDYTQTWANTDEATFDITGVQLEVGEKATPFEHRIYGDELARCQRYYVQDGGSNFHQLFGAIGFATTTTSCALKAFLPVPMRNSATLSFTGTPRLDNGQAGFNCSALTGSHPNTDLNYYSMTATSSSLTTHQPLIIDAGSTAALVKIDAEL